MMGLFKLLNNIHSFRDWLGLVALLYFFFLMSIAARILFACGRHLTRRENRGDQD